MSRNRVMATGHAVGVNARSIIPAGNLTAGAAPGVIQRVLGIEVVHGGSRRCRLADHHFTGVDGATC